MPTKLTPFERLVLINQFRLLKAAGPKSDEWDANIEILEKGYEAEYWRFMPEGKTMSVDEANEVVDILEMWAALQHFAEKNPNGPVGKDEVVFPGFDGNEPGRNLSYAEHVINSGSRFSYLRTQEVRGQKYLNSHSPNLGVHRRMLEKWRPDRNKNLTEEEAIRIWRACIHPTQRAGL